MKSFQKFFLFLFLINILLFFLKPSDESFVEFSMNELRSTVPSTSQNVNPPNYISDQLGLGLKFNLTHADISKYTHCREHVFFKSCELNFQFARDFGYKIKNIKAIGIFKQFIPTPGFSKQLQTLKDAQNSIETKSKEFNNNLSNQLEQLQEKEKSNDQIPNDLKLDVRKDSSSFLENENPQNKFSTMVDVWFEGGQTFVGQTVGGIKMPDICNLTVTGKNNTKFTISLSSKFNLYDKSGNLISSEDIFFMNLRPNFTSSETLLIQNSKCSEINRAAYRGIGMCQANGDMFFSNCPFDIGLPRNKGVIVIE